MRLKTMLYLSCLWKDIEQRKVFEQNGRFFHVQESGSVDVLTVHGG
jgi:hypothetical protein